MPPDPLTVIAESYKGIHDSTQQIARVTTLLAATQELLVLSQQALTTMQRATQFLIALALLELGLLLLGTAGLLWWHLTH